MPTYKNCTMDTYYRDGDLPWLDTPCEVTFDDKLITITYYDDTGKVVYNGHELVAGVYKLKGSDNCDACLYGGPDRKVLYGGWKMPSSTISGVWDIRLGIIKQ